MTFGQLKFRLTKAFAGVDADLIEGWITDCYQEVLGALPWTRLTKEAVLSTVAPCSVGTVSVTAGSASVALAGGTWLPGMTGMGFRVKGYAEEYQFTYVGAASGTLDRPYSGASSVAAEYSIYRAVYTLPTDCRFLEEGAFDSFETGPLRRVGIEQGQRYHEEVFGAPQLWWSQMDDSSTPPRMQVRFLPIPDAVYGIPLTYCAEVPNPSGSSSAMTAWASPTALIEGASARVKRHLKDYPGAEAHQAAYNAALSNMRSGEAYLMGPTMMGLAGHYTAHRSRRG
jgi:hypothetical protein